jgi:hypothetical protein
LATISAACLLSAHASVPASPPLAACGSASAGLLSPFVPVAEDGLAWNHGEVATRAGAGLAGRTGLLSTALLWTARLSTALVWTVLSGRALLWTVLSATALSW